MGNTCGAVEDIVTEFGCCQSNANVRAEEVE